MPNPRTGTLAKRLRGEGEGSGPSQKRSRSGRTISQQLHDDVVHGTPWDEDLSGAATGLSKEDESSIREMMPDVREMAQNADEGNGPVGWYFYISFQGVVTAHPLQKTSVARFPCYPTALSIVSLRPRA
jgi:hypothetical protein